MGDQERIEAAVADQLVNHLFVAGLALHRARASTSEVQVREDIEAALDELDVVIQTIRTAVGPLQSPEEEGTQP